MKNYGKLISVIAVLIGLFVMSVSVSAADLAIIVVDGKAVVGNGTSGVAIVASYDEDGKLTKVVKEYVTESSSTVLNVKNGDKVMYWDGLETMNPLSDAVTVTDVISDEDKETIYEAAVDKALREALGKNKGKDMTELQKALALHDWLVMNCQYDVTTSRPNAHTAYGAIVEGYAVCDGYANAYNDLLGRVGVTATYVLGRKPLHLGEDPQLHAWSCVTIGGKKYHVDVTADDPVPDLLGTVSRGYFLVSDTVLNRAGYVDYATHCTDTTYEKYDMFTGFYMQFIWNDDIIIIKEYDINAFKGGINMKNYRKVIAVIAVLTGLFVMSVSASAADSAITVSGGKAVVGNGTSGVAIVASYDEDGKLTNVVKEYVTKSSNAVLDVKNGDKVMYWDGLETMKPLSDAVTVTDDISDEDKVTIYEAAVDKALCEALGKNKGKDMTELQKALALHDWLVINCQYDVTVSRPYAHTAYGAIVEGYAVCDGYAKAYNDLLSRVGVTATIVEGRKPLHLGDNPQPHAWSCVTIDGKKYHVDVTADDPVPDKPGTVSRERFLVSDNVLNKAEYVDYTTHCTETTYEEYDMFTGFYMQFIWNEDIQKFYYLIWTKVKTTSDFTETLTPSSSENGAKPTSYIITEDGKYICFFKPSFITSQSTVYLYSFETDKYYTYTIKDINNVIFCRIRQKGNNIEVVRDYYKNNMPYIVNVGEDYSAS